MLVVSRNLTGTPTPRLQVSQIVDAEGSVNDVGISDTGVVMLGFTEGERKPSISDEGVGASTM